MSSGPSAQIAGNATITRTGLRILWDALSGVYDQSDVNDLDDETFTHLVWARIIGPAPRTTPSGC